MRLEQIIQDFSESKMELKDSSYQRKYLDLTCPYCSKCGCKQLIDGDTINIPAHLYKSTVYDLTLGITTCSFCTKTSWLIVAAFAAKKLEAKENNTAIQKGFLNFEDELPIQTRMMFNCDPGNEKSYDCTYANLKWLCMEYRLDNPESQEPFQVHYIGAFSFSKVSDVISPYGVANCGDSAKEFKIASEFLTRNWEKFVHLAEKRQNITVHS